MPNHYGGRENLEAIEFLQRLNELRPREHPGALTIAEESTAWPGVSRPTYVGGLGFGFKWNMGWMHDTLHYFGEGPGPPQATTTTSSPSACSTPSPRTSSCRSRHDEVVHGKGSLLDKMPGDDWQKFANLRAAATATCGAIRARSCSSWAASSAQGASGTTTRASTGICSTIRCTRACSGWSRT